MKTFLALLTVCCLMVAPANADIVFNLNTEFSGADDPQGTSDPWLKATFADTSTGVNLLLETVGLVGSEKATEWYFNVNTLLQSDLDTFAFTYNSPASSLAESSVTIADMWIDAHKADGDGKYDMLMTFTPSGTTFGAGMTLSYDITGTLGGVGVTASDFDTYSFPAGGAGPYVTAAHIQGIDVLGDGSNSGSGWIADEGGTGGHGGNAVPEPGSFVAMLGLFSTVGLISVVRRRRRK